MPGPVSGQGETVALSLEDVLDAGGEDAALAFQADGFDAVVTADGDGAGVAAAGSVPVEAGSSLALYDFVDASGDVLASLGIDIDASVDLLPSA